MKTSITTHEGPVALVSGAAQGISQTIALALAERGAEVIATHLTLPRQTVNKIGRSAHAFQLDVTQEEDWRSVSLKTCSCNGRRRLKDNVLAISRTTADLEFHMLRARSSGVCEVVLVFVVQEEDNFSISIREICPRPSGASVWAM
jgi:NAD(P)-dependent dehydrogenase (short-subunit alcohol dehydrogenase family)